MEINKYAVIYKCGKLLFIWDYMTVDIYYYINFNMSDSAQLIKIIGDVLQPDDANLRKQSEEILTTLRN